MNKVNDRRLAFTLLCFAILPATFAFEGRGATHGVGFGIVAVINAIGAAYLWFRNRKAAND
jgi:hypothetical protein